MSVDRLDPSLAVPSNLLKAAATAERDAQSRIVGAKKRADQAQLEADQRIEGIRDEYVKRSEAEGFRQDAAIESQRSKGYERVRDLQRANASDESRLLREGERDVSLLKDHYRDTVHSTDHQGEERLRDLERKFALSQETALKRHADETEQAEARFNQRMGELRERKESGLASQDEQSRAEYDRLVQNHQEASLQSKERFDETFRQLESRNRETLDQVQSRAGQQIREIRADTSRKLAAYSVRQKDPFYQMMETGARLEEKENAYVLTARIPEHERSNLSVNVRGNQIVLSGNRRNEEKLEREPGRVQSTSSFQTYSEAFPITYPVEAKLLAKEFDGDTLIVTVPKKGPFTEPFRKEPKSVARARAERPQFPGNLPLAASNEDEVPSPPDGGDGTSKGTGSRKAGRTLG